MKLLSVLFLLLLLVVNSWSANNEEFRATWVITWEYASSNGDTAAMKARIRQILDDHETANMNAVLWQVRQSGTAYYSSSYEPWGYYLGYQNPGFDPLEYAVQEAHKRGMELHAWFNVFHASSTHAGAPAAEHPEWVCRDGYGNPMPASRALSAGLQEVRDYTLNVAMEIVNKYDIDGLHLDYIRWNEYDRFDFSDDGIASKKAWEQLDGVFTEEKMETMQNTASIDRYLYDAEHAYSDGVPDSLPGVPFTSWEHYWRWSVTEFVKELHTAIQSVKPWVRLSPAALGRYNWDGWNGYYSVFQDAAKWFNEGYVDQLTPMNYHWLTGDSFYGMLEGDCPRCWGMYIQEGVDAGRLFSAGPGSYLLSDYNIWYRHKEIVRRSREVDWVDGFQFFSYGSWEDQRYWDQATTDLFPSLTKIRSRDSSVDPPAAPQLELVKIDSLNYHLTVTPMDPGNEDYWFCIYRSEDDTLGVQDDEIVSRQFGRSAFTHDETFTGNQDFTGNYHYFATAFNRHWNESEISDSHETDIIPSFAPVVVETRPAEGDTIKINERIQITFSKTIDEATVPGHVRAVPAIPFESLNWSKDRKTLTLQPDSLLEFATDYTITLSDSIADVNGKMLDGNGDGGESEPFVLHFRTREADTDGPMIVYEKSLSNLDIQDVCTFSFDEFIDEETVSDASAYILYEEEPIPSKARVYQVENYSVLGVQPETPFLPSTAYQVVLDTSITDMSGNRMEERKVSDIYTGAYSYTDTILIDNFSSISDENWRDPDYSGQTTGTLPPQTTFTRDIDYYLPAATRESGQKTSGELHYEWDPEATSFFIREYLVPSSPEGKVTFDTTYNLQCYVFGDGSNNYLRFSLSEKNGNGYPLEVSYWILIDWTGWKLVEWDMSDPFTVGSWLGNEVLDGSKYSFDSFQITRMDEEGAMSGSLFFQHLRAVKREIIPVGIGQDKVVRPLTFSLRQNYPNPFNPLTKIEYTVAEAGVTELALYDILGRKLETLVKEHKNPGAYTILFDGSQYASGTYIYQLKTENNVLRKKMTLVK